MKFKTIRIANTSSSITSQVSQGCAGSFAFKLTRPKIALATPARYLLKIAVSQFSSTRFHPWIRKINSQRISRITAPNAASSPHITAAGVTPRNLTIT